MGSEIDRIEWVSLERAAARMARSPEAALLPVLWAAGNAVRAGLGRWGGALSDRLGRRPLLLAAWLLYAACYAASWGMGASE